MQAEWNRMERASLLTQQPSMGGMMPAGVAQSIVKGMVNHQVASWAQPTAPQPVLLSAAEVTAAPKPVLLPATEVAKDARELVVPSPPVQKRNKGGRPKKPKKAVPPLETLTAENLDYCTAKELLDIIDEYRKLPGFVSLPRKKQKHERKEVLLQAMQDHKRQLSDSTTSV